MGEAPREPTIVSISTSPHEGALDEGNRCATLVADVTVKTGLGHYVVVTAQHLAFGDRAGEFHDAVVGVHDQRHIAPAGNVSHCVDEMLTRCKAPHVLRQRFDDRPGGDVELLRDIFDDGAGLGGHASGE